MRPTTAATMIATATAGAPACGKANSRHPVAITTTMPAAMLTTVLIRADPVAATGDAPARCASAPMAAICQSLPGTYRPRLETVQIRAAVPNGSRRSQAESIARHVWMRTR
jgi:hypothetical protein